MIKNAGIKEKCFIVATPLALVAVTALLSVLFVWSVWTIVGDSRESKIQTNNFFIDTLYDNSLNLSDSNQVFRFVFSNLPDEVVVYPTENYFYFRFTTNGKNIWGSFTLFSYDRDDGIFGFGYSEHYDDPDVRDSFSRVGGGGTYTAKDGVVVKKLNDWKYSVTFEGKTVVFRFNDVGMTPPQKAKLRPEEVFVGPSFDESGLKFFLIFNKEEERLYLVLNEDGFVPEDFEERDSNSVRGLRTGFVFYLDKENSRKIIVGVKGENVLKNNWYDGPFDQMPDNYVYTGQIPDYQKYLEAAYSGTAGRIDKYGNYLDDKGTRIAVAPYTVYFSEQDLAFIQSCKVLNLTKPQFYSCITRQVFDVPEGFR